MKKLILTSVSALAVMTLAACSDSSDQTTTQSTTPPAAAEPATPPATTATPPATAPATTDGTTTQSIETQPNVPESGSGGMTESNPAMDTTAPTPPPAASTTPAQ